METVNATITSTQLGIEHGVLTYMIRLNYGASCQGFGGYVLGGTFGCEAIKGVLTVAGVESWEDLPGKPVRAVCSYDKVSKIGHFLKDEWLDLEALVAATKEVE